MGSSSLQQHTYSRKTPKVLSNIETPASVKASMTFYLWGVEQQLANALAPDPLPAEVGGHAMNKVSNREIAHEIGLIPLSAGENKYVGPSSGFPFAKLVFARAGKASPGIIHSLARHYSSVDRKNGSSFSVGPHRDPLICRQSFESVEDIL